ncbi:MAG: glycine C-acetyltransferase [Clostridiaceae bacterium]|nr:glycine C-acetyltransferase [Clostridiaceae bacterium]
MKQAYTVFKDTLKDIDAKGLRKTERILSGPQGASIQTTERSAVLNLCANNYLGLSSDSRVIEEAKKSYDQYGFGLSSVRFICGTQTIHKQLEEAVSDFLGMDDTILYSSCFDANGGLFETLLTDADAVVSDELNHASIIDGIRLCKAERYRYRNNDMTDLECQLQAARQNKARIILIVTDGVFSMDGTYANLTAICDLADEYEALVMVDDSHAVGFVGPNGRGTPEYCGVTDRIDILTGTFGKALGGGSGGYTSARQPIVDLLRQRSRPYLFSNTLAPAIAAATLEVIRILKTDHSLKNKLDENTKLFRSLMQKSGFDIIPGTHPIVPVMIYDEERTVQIADLLLEQGIYVIGFTYPVVPLGKARIRTQVSAAHTPDQLVFASECFRKFAVNK